MWRLLLITALSLAAAAPATGPRELLWEHRARPVLSARGPAPAAPFRFVAEDHGGRSPKVTVRDARNTEWSVKFGPEVRAETFATRLVWALGYYSDASWFLGEGKIEGARDLERAAAFIGTDGKFRDARFEYRDPACRLLTDANWSWTYNPFPDSRELNGLRILMMLLSNWDHKDAREAESNTGILECGSGRDRRLIYYVSDWGSSLGKWGRKFFHNKWDCEGFAEQSPEFVTGVHDGEVRFGFSSGRRSDEFKTGISVEDVRWFLARIEHLTSPQLRAALRDSGANEHETEHFTRALLARIEALRQAADANRSAASRLR